MSHNVERLVRFSFIEDVIIEHMKTVWTSSPPEIYTRGDYSGNNIWNVERKERTMMIYRLTDLLDMYDLGGETEKAETEIGIDMVYANRNDLKRDFEVLMSILDDRTFTERYPILDIMRIEPIQYDNSKHTIGVVLRAILQ